MLDFWPAVASTLFLSRLSFGSILPFALTTSTKHNGPDGPCQAVEVSLGTPIQKLDLFPGSTFETIILTTTVCNGTEDGLCGQGGLFDPEFSNCIDSTSIQYSTHDHGSSVDWTPGAMHYSGEAVYVLDSLDLAAIGSQRSQVIPDLSIRMLTQISLTYPDGSRYPLQVGQLALGSSDINQTFVIGNGESSVNASLVPLIICGRQRLFPLLYTDYTLDQHP